jgi:hypothetical protein
MWHNKKSRAFQPRSLMGSGDTQIVCPRLTTDCQSEISRAYGGYRKLGDFLAMCGRMSGVKADH